MKSAEDILNEWEEEYDQLRESSIYNFYDTVNEGKGGHTGDRSVFMFFDKSKWRNITFLGVKANLKLYKTHPGIPKERLERLDMVCKNITTKTFYRYLINTYIAEGMTPKLKDLNLDDYVKLMRAINMSNAILKINFAGDVWFMGNFKDNKHSFCVTFPRGVFVRRKPGQIRFETKYNTDRPQYTWMEIYDGINGFDLDGSEN